MSLRLIKIFLSSRSLSNVFNIQRRQTAFCCLSKNFHQKDNKPQNSQQNRLSSTQTEDSGKVLTIPNILSIFRIVSTPYVCHLILSSQFTSSLCWFAVASISDLLDGAIARRWPSQQSKLGAVIDPLGDKLLVGATCFCLTYIQVIPLWLTCLFLSKDFFLIAYGLLVRYRTCPPPVTFKRFLNPSMVNVEVQASMLSKTNTMLQMILLWTSMCFNVFDVNENVLHAMWALTAATTTASMIQYCIKKPFKIIPPKK